MLPRWIVVLALILPTVPQSYEEYLAQSRSSLIEKRFKDAEAAAEKAIQLDSNRWEAYILAANAYSSQRLYDDAIGMLQMALSRITEDKKSLVREALAELRKPTTASPPAQSAAGAPPSAPATKGVSDPLLTWTDPKTGLMWARKDNETDIIWGQADLYCQKLTLAGYSDWKLPHMDELYGLYDPSTTILVTKSGGPAVKFHLKLGLRLTSWPWSGPVQALFESGEYKVEMQGFDFTNGQVVHCPVTGGQCYGRALCVRHPKK